MKAISRRRAWTFLFLAIMWWAPGEPLSASPPARVNIGAASVSSSALSLWAAQEQGIFAKHGVEAQLVLIRGGSTPIRVSSFVSRVGS